MTLTKLAGLSILITVFFQNTLILGETFLSTEIDKVGGLKSSEKRTNNFRVPVEMPYDPNFWPARGRRNRRDPEKAIPNDGYIIFDGNFMFHKNGLQCPEISKIQEEELSNRKSGPSDFELMPPINLDDKLLSGSEKMKSDCYGNAVAFKTTEGLNGRLGVKIPALSETNLLMNPKLFNELRPKKQKLMGLPEIVLYGKEVYWTPESLYGEKKKKQDVFWVTRDMLKQTLATCIAFIFLGLLSSVTSEEFLANIFGYENLPILISTLKERCSERLDPFSCRSLDTIRYKISDPESTNIFRWKQIKELLSENTTSKEKTAEENFANEIPISNLIVDPENHLQKRFTVFRRKSPVARGYKRGPGFRSWGGKRDSTFFEQNLDKKSKFVSWGGKRDGEFFPKDSTSSDVGERDAPDKRPKFQNWGGKKSTNDFLGEPRKTENLISDDSTEKKRLVWKNRRFYLSEPFKKHVPKRPQFQSWGGKRAQYPWHKFFTFLQEKPKLFLNGGEKRKFSSWGGKRYNENINRYGESSSEVNFKRSVFQNWGGKREVSDVSSHRDNESVFLSKESEPVNKIKKRESEADASNRENDINSSDDELRDGKDGR